MLVLLNVGNYNTVYEFEITSDGIMFVPNFIKTLPEIDL
jgi:hypothetical protein